MDASILQVEREATGRAIDAAPRGGRQRLGRRMVMAQVEKLRADGGGTFRHLGAIETQGKVLKLIPCLLDSIW